MLRTVQGLTLWQIDLMSERGRRRFFNKTLRKYTVRELLLALMEKNIQLSDEQMAMLKEGE